MIVFVVPLSGDGDAVSNVSALVSFLSQWAAMVSAVLPRSLYVFISKCFYGQQLVLVGVHQSSAK
jgi:hypothetical protein